jgi:integrase
VIGAIPRDRALDDHEIASVYLAAQNLGYPFGPFTQLAIILGQRRGEIAALRRSWINLTSRTITFPREVMKGNRPHVIPYGSTATAIFESLLPSGDLLFPARGTADRPLSGFSKFKLALDKEIGTIDPFTIHDLRRSFASGLQCVGIRIDVTEWLLAHRSGSFAGIVSVYQQHDLMPEMRDAVSKWETHVASLVTAREQVSATRAA